MMGCKSKKRSESENSESELFAIMVEAGVVPKNDESMT